VKPPPDSPRRGHIALLREPIARYRFRATAPLRHPATSRPETVRGIYTGPARATASLLIGEDLMGRPPLALSLSKGDPPGPLVVPLSLSKGHHERFLRE
jgi:hypothetical protein